MAQTYRAIGLMSGSSLDGVDLAYCEFQQEGKKWTYRILHADCIPYPQNWLEELKSIDQMGEELLGLHSDIGHLYGQLINRFIDQHEINKQDILFCCVHGHTVTHQPTDGFSLQLGLNESIGDTTLLPVITDLRTADIQLGGQGAPIVPIADKLLFTEYEYCLNLGGIANITDKTGKQVLAYDICACNQILNYFAQKTGKSFDEKGRMAHSGRVSPGLMQKLGTLDYYQQAPPKSLDNSFSSETVIPIIESYNLSPEDALATATDHIARHIAKCLKGNFHMNCLVTGGGANNTHLLERIGAFTDVHLEKAPQQLIDYKEAMAMAFYGLLRWLNQPNCLASVTGAERDSCGGVVYTPGSKE